MPIKVKTNKNEGYYNNERKNKFLNFISETSVAEGTMISLSSFFHGTRQDEQRLNKDICEFTFDEIRRVFALKGWNRLQLRINYTKHFKDYVEWCCQQQLVSKEQYEVACNFKTFSPTDEDFIEKSYYFSEDDLVYRGTILLKKTDLTVTYYARAVIMWFMYFHQLEFDDMKKIRKTDVSLENRTVYVQRRNELVKDKWKSETLKIPRCMTMYFNSALNDTMLVDRSGHMRNIPASNMLLYPQGKAYQPDDEMVDTYLPEITRNMKKINSTLDVDSELYNEIPTKEYVTKSGIFCEVFKQYKNRIPARWQMEQFLPKEETDTKIARYVKDYQMWLANRRRVIEL